MTNVLFKAEKDIPKLRQFADRLIVLVNTILQKSIQYNEEDHLAFMSLCFVSKQVEHLKTICILVDAGQHKDAGLIARSMIEGMFLLLWAAHDPLKRPLLWRTYALVEDFRLMREKERAGEEIEPSHKLKIMEQLNIYGEQFLTNKAKEAMRKNLPVPEDPYCKNWSGKQIWEICEEVKGHLLYEQIYKDTSQWIHWTPRGLGTSIRRDNRIVHYMDESKDVAATALASGFQSLLQLTELIDSHLALGFTGRLTELRNLYIKELSKTNSDNSPK